MSIGSPICQAVLMRRAVVGGVSATASATLVDRGAEPQDIRIMFEYCGRKWDGSHAPRHRWIRARVVKPRTEIPRRAKAR